MLIKFGNLDKILNVAVCDKYQLHQAYTNFSNVSLIEVSKASYEVGTTAPAS